MEKTEKKEGTNQKEHRETWNPSQKYVRGILIYRQYTPNAASRQALIYKQCPPPCQVFLCSASAVKLWLLMSVLPRISPERRFSKRQTAR